MGASREFGSALPHLTRSLLETVNKMAWHQRAAVVWATLLTYTGVNFQTALSLGGSLVRFVEDTLQVDRKTTFHWT